MDTSTVSGFADKAKAFVLKYKVLVAAAVAVVVVGGGALAFFNAQPKSVIKDVEVEFTGYDGYGVLEYNSEDVQKELAMIAFRSAGLSQEQAEGLAANDEVIIAEVTSDSDLNVKLMKAVAVIENTSVSFDKTSELKNGDTVTLSVKTSSKKSPIKKEKKTFTVKGLDKIETISTKEFLKNNPVTFQGFNGYGQVVLPESEDEVALLSLEKAERDGKYKNDEKVKLTVSPTYLQELRADGKALEEETITVTVSGLKEITEIPNIADGLAKNESYIKSNYENSGNTTYTIEKQKDYISYQVDYSGSGKVYLVTLYKVHTVRTGIFAEDRTDYVYYGYSYYTDEDGKLDVDTGAKEKGYTSQDLAKLTAELETEGYKEYSKKAAE